MTVIYIYCVNCMKFGQLILRKVIQIVATRCHIFTLKCTKFDLQRSPRPSSWISRGLLLRGGDGRKGERRGGQKRREKGKGKEEEKEGKGVRNVYWGPRLLFLSFTLPLSLLLFFCFFSSPFPCFLLFPSFSSKVRP